MDSETTTQIRQTVRQLCADYPGKYWRERIATVRIRRNS